MPAQRLDFRYRREAEDAVTSSSEVNDPEEGFRPEPCPDFDPISAFYPPRSTDEVYESSNNCETQKNAQKTSMMIENLLSIRSDTCSESQDK
ncbi:unnamed protein product [Danaus chrysippus]|uniref:(African queen) hypothetical protein n=1 Tax=Danaus chrysippus TaxID=151541 RepID=A0A8J2W1P5_9NEOP|nr:unnamed protein product [Danaus chrysippus]